MRIWFLELERAIRNEWGSELMRVREGVSKHLSNSLCFVLVYPACYPVRAVPQESLQLSLELPGIRSPNGPKLCGFPPVVEMSESTLSPSAE
jgi:hypothetical protein